MRPGCSEFNVSAAQSTHPSPPCGDAGDTTRARKHNLQSQSKAGFIYLHSSF